MSRLLTAVLAIGVLLPITAWSQGNSMDFDTVRTSEDPEAQAEVRDAIKAYKRDDFLRASRCSIESWLATSVRRDHGSKGGDTRQDALQTWAVSSITELFDRVVKAGASHCILKPPLQMALLSLSENLR